MNIDSLSEKNLKTHRWAGGGADVVLHASLLHFLSSLFESGLFIDTADGKKGGSAKLVSQI